MEKKKVYFAHPICTYNTILEEYFLEYFAKSDDIEIINPNRQEHQEGCKKEGMEYFKALVQSCDCLYSFSFGDASVGAGIAKEMDWMKEKGGEIIFFPLFADFETMNTETAAEQFNVLSIEETREKLKSYKYGNYKKDKPVKAYIASPYTLGDIAVNVKTQMDMADKLMDAGFIPFAPLYSHFQHMAHPRPYQDWIKVDNVWVLVCDCVLRLEGKSSGADDEVKLAIENNIPVFYNFEDLCTYYKV
jgi:hypothetical protein